MHVKLFMKEDCPKCPAAKRAVEGLECVEVFDVASLDGLAEASFYSVLATPSILVVDSSGNEIESWRGVVPDPESLRNVLAQ
ncbi:MAG: thioredoxin family protein [Actinomycetota bacterium]|nr:thioredoxin family protein [Actinomycetota bacterium]